MTTRTLEERIIAMERELAQLKQELQATTQTETVPWWQEISGVFKDSPEFEEAVRLGGMCANITPSIPVRHPASKQ